MLRLSILYTVKFNGYHRFLIQFWGGRERYCGNVTVMIVIGVLEVGCLNIYLYVCVLCVHNIALLNQALSPCIHGLCLEMYFRQRIVYINGS